MRNERKRKYRKKALRSMLTALATVALLIGFLVFFAARWYVNTYGSTGFDSILFTLTSDLGGVESDLILSFLWKAALPALFCAGAGTIAIFHQPKKRRQWYPLSNGAALSVTAALCLALLGYGAVASGLHLYVYDMFHESAIYEERYVDPDAVEITFPEKKRNLIYIFLESMETSYFAESEGGASYTNLIPELYTLAQENVNFSQHEGVGGFRSVSGSTWTIGAMVGHTAGIPLKTPDNVKDWQNGYGEDGVFLPGVTSIMDILHDNGYYQSLMVGSVAKFGGRKVYYQTHGVDAIYELSTARRDGIVPGNYFEWWGIEDKYLFQYAKQELLEIAQKDQPFAFTMLTVDTHHIGGYKCTLCEDVHEEQYANVMSCSSRQVAEFIRWIRQQDFYENTTIVICGDHPSMDNGYFKRNVDEYYIRRMYNCFMNAPVVPEKSKHREFTSLDLFPTTLAAIGCEIEGNRLGLGTNLFSGENTLAEEMGFGRFDRQVAQKSEFYASEFRQELK